MSGETTLEELETKERRRLLSVSGRKSALVDPEEQQQIIEGVCRHFTGILADETAVPTVAQVVSYLEKAYSITRDSSTRHVSVPVHTDKSKMEEAVYAAVLILMATEASNVISPSGGSPKELFVLATALLTSNVAIAAEQIDSVIAALEAGKAGLSSEDQADLAAVITLSKLNSALITQSNLDGKNLSEKEREDALKQAITTGDSFPDATAKMQAMALLEKYDTKFQAISDKLLERMPASLAATTGVTTAASSALETTAIAEEKPEAGKAAPGGDASADEAAKKEKVVEKSAIMPQRSASMSWPFPADTLHRLSGSDQPADVNANKDAGRDPNGTTPAASFK